MLDQTDNADDAAAIMREYNISTEDFAVHFLIADRSGRAVVAEEFYDEVVVTPNQQPWHAVTNFPMVDAGDQLEGMCWRYDQLALALSSTSGILNLDTAMDLLEAVSHENTQWSIVYDISSGAIGVAMGRKYDEVHGFSMPLAGE
jgi:hypothetical protein